MNIKFIPGKIRDRRGSGFTLIELLVVAAITAVLAALLLPALSKAKQHAWTTTCLDVQKQLALAWIQYAKDSKDYLVDTIRTDYNSGIGACSSN